MNVKPGDIGIFIKFVEKRFIPSTLNGNLFFSSSTYFRQHDTCYKDETMGDVYDPYESSDRYVMRRTCQIFCVNSSFSQIDFLIIYSK